MKTAIQSGPSKDPTPWTGWFPIDHPIYGGLPSDTDGERFLVWVPGVSEDWPGEWHVAWWDEASKRIDGEWRHIQEDAGLGNVGLNATEPTHWMPGPQEP